MSPKKGTQIQRPVSFQTTSKMLYEAVDNYYPLGRYDNSIRLNNQRDLNDVSSQSIVCAMDRFVKAVNEMNETVMIPCRLLDIEVETPKTQKRSKVPKLLKAGGDPYNYYSILNSVKNDLILGTTSDDAEDTKSPMVLSSSNSTRWAGEEESESSSKKEPFRRQSTLSLASVSSTTSEGESSEAFSENTEEDDGSSEGDENAVPVNNITQALHSHLVGLQSCLKNLTDTAVYITDCYKEGVNL